MKNDFYQINGLSGASYLYFIAQHFESGIVILPSSIDLNRARDALKFFFNDEKDIFCFPAFERLFEPIRQEPAIVFQRLQTQAALLTQKRPFFLLTQFEALAQAVIPPKELERAQRKIEKKGWIARDEFLIYLQSIGYRRDELAEDQGFFSVRGHLIDLFSPFHPHPFRIEFFGDEIVSIRTFDPKTQRSLTDLDSLEISPIRELISSPDKMKGAREKIKEAGDARGLSFDERERLLGDLENQQDVGEPHWLLPAFSSGLTSLEDYLPKDLPSIFVDRTKATDSFHSTTKADEEAFEGLKKFSFPPSALSSSVQNILEAKGHELDTLISGRGLTYQVATFEDLRESLLKSKSFGPLESLILDIKDKNIRSTLVIGSSKRREALGDSLEKVASSVEWKNGPYFDGFWSTSFQKAFITERDIFGVKKKRAQYLSRSKEDFLRQFSDLNDGDYVIHEDHGISKYRGLQKIQIGVGTTEFLVLEYAESDKLYLPVYRLDKLSRYVGEGLAEPRLDRLGSQVFSKRKLKIKDDILKIAHELLAVAAERKMAQIERAQDVDLRTYQTFCDDFPYELTPDQEAASLEIEKDLRNAYPMDRLVCGDVGFGKTEVAMRACLLSILRGFQVAVLAPTTILVEQHFRNFLKRFSKTGVKVAKISRFSSAAEQRKILEDLESGRIDLIIGTHRLLGPDVKFKNIGMLVIDEEQKFGVKHKERIKKFRTNLDVLTLSATPIPRTLQLSVAGIKELSLITTPPENREAVKTIVGSFEQGLIKSAIEKEIARGGQVLVVHNRVQTIQGLATQLKEWLPNIRFTVAHGQMSETELEQKMVEFIDGDSDVLIATSIIENGLDIPTANTLIVDHAELFGLSNLYQLRGRVGRSHLQATAYFLIHETTELTKEASKRLQVIQTCTELGSGFNVATHDMEIRGSGNILGEEQSGVIAEVGLELYSQMLQETLAELKNEKPPLPLPDLNTGYTAFIPETYIPDPAIRIATYKQLNKVHTPAELVELEDELLDRFGLYPREVENFCQILRLRTYASALRAESLDVFPGRLAVLLSSETPLEPKKLIPLLGKEVSLDSKGRISFSFKSSGELKEQEDFQKCRQFLKKLCELSSISVENI